MRTALQVVAGAVLVYVAIAIFERLAPRRFVKRYWRLVNPLFRPLAGWLPGFVLLETIGRRSGRSHQVSVGGRSSRGSVWIVAANPTRADYVRNIEANPRVRVRVNGRWRTGAGHVLRDDNPRRRTVRVNPLNGIFTRIASSDLATIRIDLH